MNIGAGNARNAIKGTGVAPLLYWLAVICGLSGITILRIDEPRRIVPLWFGSIVGIALGQTVALLRIRVWMATAVGLLSSWIIGPAVYLALCEIFGFGTETETALFALLPAFVCGYASLTERGGLLAFWYPAMLWMLVILDGEAPGTFAPRAYLPMVIGLGVFFVAFLRARESRRVALWRAYATTRLATTAAPAVLRASPMSGFAQLAWTGLVGGGALLLAAWIAPNLWQKDRTLHEKAATVPPPVRYAVDSPIPCCPQSWETETIREYMTIRNDRDVARSRMECSYCPPTVRVLGVEETGPYASHRGCGVRAIDPSARASFTNYPFQPDYVGYNLGYNTSGYTSYYGMPMDGNHDYSVPVFPNAPAIPPGLVDAAPVATPVYVAPIAVDPPPPPPPPPPPVIAKAAPVVVHKHVPPVHPRPVAAPPVAAPPFVAPPALVAVPSIPVPPATPAPSPPPKPAAAPSPPPPVAHDTAPSHGPAPDPGAPWGLLLPLLAGVVVLPLGSRFVRRKVTLRHLARPFWRESIDQRISNHWQRMLVGLRDAGIQTRVGEQPQAFAKRIAIEGMEECATILERVRHGVRVDANDLAAMDNAATSICRIARARAGVAGRVAASVRWPLV